MQNSALNAALGVEITLVSEHNQRTGSFKYRAAESLVLNTPARHFIAASSGNFAAGLACACKQHGKSCTVVMPDDSVQVKVDSVRSFGADVILIDTRVISRQVKLEELRAQYPEACITNAYDNEWIIKGNASLGIEIAKLVRPLPDVVIVPIGGGGLSSGIVLGLKREGSQARVVGAEPLLANDATLSLKAGHIVSNHTEPKGTIADGARTISLGKLNWEILSRGLSGIVEVPENFIEQGMRLLYKVAGLRVEPTAALSIGALLTDHTRFAGKHVVCVVSGGNVDPELFERVMVE